MGSCCGLRRVELILIFLNEKSNFIGKNHLKLSSRGGTEIIQLKGFKILAIK